MKRVAWLILGVLFWNGASANVYDFFSKVRTQIRENRSIKAAAELERWLAGKKRQELVDHGIYLLSWAYYQQKDYIKAFTQAQKLVLNYPSSPYYFSALLMTSALSFFRGNSEEALKVLDWIITHPPAEEKYLFAAYVLKAVFQKKSPEKESNPFSPDVYRLVWDFLPLFLTAQKETLAPEQKKKVKETEIQPEKEKVLEEKKEEEKKTEIKSQLKQKENQTRLPAKKNLTGFEKREMSVKDLEKKLALEKKELEIQRILLEEKKRLLYLKEQYLKEKEEVLGKEALK